MTGRSGTRTTGGDGRTGSPPRKTRAQRFREDVGFAALLTLFFGVPGVLAMWTWHPLLIFPAVLLIQWVARWLGPLLRGRRGLARVSVAVAWLLGLVLSGAVVAFGVNLLLDIDPGCVPSETVRCNLVIDGRVVGEADASHAQGVRVQQVLISVSIILLGAVPFLALLRVGYRALRSRAR
ncbi:hypothetical protein GCM10027160_42510 [Streptomyces calidiresistens]|uniref:Uncharacterized protein n=1 Tax=Streptomyces calidiresistens TaxID=1485586 RepID=A0A7W3T691_9ACTN|nr:hypothetical protein [Streptomyces calidiresistens]MBB0231416.1 hypothetical protein [Streptomyces calidiresistens]